MNPYIIPRGMIDKTQKRPATLEDLARASGVSRRVVSAVLNSDRAKGKIGYSEETKLAVEAAAQALNYRRNRTSTNLKEKRHGVIGVLASSLYSIPNVTPQPIIECAARHNLLVTFEIIQPNKVPQFIQDDVVDGLLLFENVGSQLEEEIDRLGIPCVYSNAGMYHRPYAIEYDERQNMEQIVAQFAAQGRKRIVLFLSSIGVIAEEREQGLRESCAQHGLLEPIIFCHTGSKAEQIRAVLEPQLPQFLAQHRDIDAIILNQDVAAPVVYHALAEMSKAVPNDVAVIGLHNQQVDYAVTPQLSSTAMNYYKANAASVDLLVEVIKGTAEVGIRWHYYNYIQRAST